MKRVIEMRDDVVFYLKMFPLKSIHPQAYSKSKTIVCEKHRSNENAIKLLEDVYAKKSIPEPECDTDVVDKNIALAQRLGIRSTPTIVFENGKVVSGAMKAEQLIKLIDRIQTN
jgi:thiol:disulfide interchange protein DsbC